MERILIKEDSEEKEYMDIWLANHPLNEGIINPKVAYNVKYQEAWEYMGSYRKDMKIFHEFRHRCHPSDDQIHFLELEASENISGKDIKP